MNYSFYYINQNIQEVEIKDDQSFNEFLDNSSNLNNEIFIKEKKINILDKVEETIIFNNINEEPQLSLIDNNYNKNNNNNAEESNISLGTKMYNGEKSENSTFIIKGDSLLKKLESNEKVKSEHESKISLEDSNSNSNSNKNSHLINKESIPIKFEEQDKNIEEEKIKEENQKTIINNLTSKVSKLQIRISNLEKEKEDMIKENEEILKQNDIVKKAIKLSKNEAIFHQQSLKKSNEEKEKLQNEIDYLKNNYDSIIVDYKKKLSLLEKENIELKKEKSIFESSICKTVHKNIKCKHCFSMPIIGYRYKCSQCDDYNLCQQCYDENSESRNHSHFFYRIKTSQENNMNNNANIININNFIPNNQNIATYSYKCLSPDIKKVIYNGKYETNVRIIIQNDSSYKWPQNTKFIWDKNKSQLLTEDIQVKSLSPKEQMTLDIPFKDLQNLNSGEYKTFFDFNVEGHNYGNQLCVFVVVKQENEKDIINFFRNKYKTPKEYKDETISKLLDLYNGDFEETYFKLYFSEF